MAINPKELSVHTLGEEPTNERDKHKLGAVLDILETMVAVGMEHGPSHAINGACGAILNYITILINSGQAPSPSLLRSVTAESLRGTAEHIMLLGVEPTTGTKQ